MQECFGKFYLHNGQPTPTELFDDSFLAYPQYIYEVFRVIDGVALFLEDHLLRLKKTCELSGHCPGFSCLQIYQQVYQLIDANGMQSGNVKIVLFSRDEEQHCLVYLSEHQYPTPEQYQQGVPVVLFKGVRHNPNAKVMDVMLRHATNIKKQQLEVYETLLVDQEGCITEGSRSNVFFIRHDRVVTPPLEDVLPGITRKHIMEVCRELGLEMVEEKVPARSVVVMEAAFISGTSRKVLPLNKIDDLDFDAHHPLTRKIQSGFEAKVRSYIQSHL